MALDSQPTSAPITLLMVMRLFPGMMPIYDVPSRPPEGMPTLYKLIRGLADAGHSVHFTGVVNPAIDAVPQRTAGGAPFVDNGVTFRTIELPYSRILSTMRIINPLRVTFTVFKYLWLIWKLARLIRECHPQVLYIGGPYHFFGGLLGKVFGIPTVLRFYGVHNLWEIRQSRFSFTRDPWALLAFRTHFDFAVITNDGSFGDRVARSYGVPEHKVGFWINGVDQDAYVPGFDRKGFLRKMGITGQPPIVVSVDRLQDWKRQDRLIRSMPRVLESVPGAQLCLVGDGPRRSELEALATALEVQKNVRFLGSVPHSDVYGFIQSADVYASVHDLSNMPVGLWEAMVCGRPVITLDDGAFAGLVENDRELVLIQPTEVDTHLAPALAELLLDEERRARLGAAAREFALNSLDTWEQRIAREVSVLESLARRERPSW